MYFILNKKKKLDGTLLSHTTNLNAFVLAPAVRICRVRALKERKYQLSVAIFDVRDGTPTLSLLKVPFIVIYVLGRTRELFRTVHTCTV